MKILMMSFKIQSFNNDLFDIDDHKIDHPIFTINIANNKKKNARLSFNVENIVIFPLQFFWPACSAVAKQL
jgi:hypothetical protein